jgi:hypothetical protein
VRQPRKPVARNSADGASWFEAQRLRLRFEAHDVVAVGTDRP